MEEGDHLAPGYVVFEAVVGVRVWVAAFGDPGFGETVDADFERWFVCRR